MSSSEDLDQSMPAPVRDDFHIPKHRNFAPYSNNTQTATPDAECIYMSWNSLGLCAKNASKYVNRELQKWADIGLWGHEKGELPWVECEDLIEGAMAEIVGAKREEVALMSSLTVNLHLMLVSFYRPTGKRVKILCEHMAFPSDFYAFTSQLRMHGLEPKDCLLEVKPRSGEACLRTEDILDIIQKEGDEIAVMCFSGVQYYTGQLFEIHELTQAAQSRGIVVGWDLAHAVGNVELKLSEWNVDFAVWCTYKYMCSSAGGIGGFYVNSRHFDREHRLIGWWAHNLATRFDMNNKLDLGQGASGFKVSNMPPLLVSTLQASLELFAKAGGMSKLRQRSLKLTGFLEQRLMDAGIIGKPESPIEVLTPSDPQHRGAQLSLKIRDTAFSQSSNEVVDRVKAGFDSHYVVVDVRRPGVIRVAPSPLCSTFNECEKFVEILNQIMADIKSL